MKTFLIVSGLLLVLVASGGVATLCMRYRTPPTTEVVVLRDVTEAFSAQPNAADLLKLYDAHGERRWNGAKFYFSDLSDVSLNGVRETHLEAGNKWLSNELQRDKAVKQFQRDVASIVNDSVHTPVGREHSSVYVPLVQALTRLSQSNADKKVLVVYSDLMENTPEISFYNVRVLAVLREHPEQIVQAWEARTQLPTLAGITVYLVYQPKDARDDATYRTLSNFYKQLLESKGAAVRIEANLLND